ncbi:MAG TPA: 2Fe-2S iron-sulfur cluster binding domain-containing protein [Clostridiales bacterium]|nr:2Fe-2S iron-sulfur cluster binding domain-containing protein [Clostridiales bacterium]
MNMVNITINNKKIQVPEGTTILNAAKQAGIDIPVLCYHPDLDIKANCRICVVEVEGARTLQTACSTRVWEGMAVRTNTPKVRQARKIIVELILAGHEMDCTYCKRNNRCDLQKIAADLGIRENPFRHVERDLERDTSGPSLERNPNKCIKCGRCIQMCGKVQGLSLLDYAGRSDEVEIKPAFGKYLTDIACVACGQCAVVCPVAAITEKEDIDRVWEAINDPDKVVIVQTAPAVRVALGEEFGFEPGKVVTGKMVAALRALGFDKVFDTDFTADLTIIEEGNELLQRLSNGGVLPMLTSCSPGWINFIEQYYPELLPHVSTCKSPQQMFGALAKGYYAAKIGKRPEDIFSVSIMPCTAKKYEAQRPEMSVDGKNPDVDVVLTTRELAKMLRQAGINFDALEEEEYDAPFGLSTGAAVIFGATGGVMEAALRTVYEVVTGKTLPSLDFKDVRGLEGIKEATVDLNGTPVKVAVAHTLANARKLMELIKSGKADYAFIEIMCCPGGCIGGGGQPYGTTNEVRKKRIAAIYEADRDLPIRKSHENPAIKKLYEEFLGEPLGEKSHHLLHTHYNDRKA